MDRSIHITVVTMLTTRGRDSGVDRQRDSPLPVRPTAVQHAMSSGAGAQDGSPTPANGSAGTRAPRPLGLGCAAPPADEGEWYVVMTQARNEQLALTNLQRQNFTAFLPRRWVTKRRPRGFHRILEPVFPRYLFVQLDLDLQRWRSINGTYGVSRLVTFGDRPTPLAREVVDTLRLSTGQNGAIQFTEPLGPGDRVRLVSGPFAELFGMIEHLDGHGRVRLLIELLGGRVRLNIPRADLDRVPARDHRAAGRRAPRSGEFQVLDD
jgi:transcriptional antiterminator RfaH